MNLEALQELFIDYYVGTFGGYSIPMKEGGRKMEPTWIVLHPVLKQFEMLDPNKAKQKLRAFIADACATYKSGNQYGKGKHPDVDFWKMLVGNRVDSTKQWLEGCELCDPKQYRPKRRWSNESVGFLTYMELDRDGHYYEYATPCTCRRAGDVVNGGLKVSGEWRRYVRVWSEKRFKEAEELGLSLSLYLLKVYGTELIKRAKEIALNKKHAPVTAEKPVTASAISTTQQDTNIKKASALEALVASGEPSEEKFTPIPPKHKKRPYTPF